MRPDPPNPWNFGPKDSQFVSPNGRYAVEYTHLGEIAMSAPFGGSCYILWEGNKLDLDKHCAGPLVWNPHSTLLALPIWNKQRSQQIAVVDIQAQKLTVYGQVFRVLHLTEFRGNWIKGIDSPIYRTEEVQFDVTTEKVESVIQLKIIDSA